MAEQTLIIALVSGVASGLGVAVINYVSNRKKINAETDKIRAETDKIRSELKDLSITVSHNLPEEIIFGSQEVTGFDVKGQEAKFWTGMGKEARPTSEKGEGTLKIEEGGMLNIQRTNTVGRFEVILSRYFYNGRECALIPGNELMAGKRMLKLTFEAKALGAEHTLRGVLRNPNTGKRFDDNTFRVNENQWSTVKMSLKADPHEECQVRIDDEQVSSAPSSVQIRKLRVVETRNVNP